MLLKDIETNAKTFAEYGQNIDTYQKLVYVLAHIARSEGLHEQLADWFVDNPAILDRRVADELLETLPAFGVDLSPAEFEQVFDNICNFIVQTDADTYDEEPQVDYNAIFRLAALGVNVHLTFAGVIETLDEEEDTLTNIGVEFDLGTFTLIV